jgi:hypothetical protein
MRLLFVVALGLTGGAGDHLVAAPAIEAACPGDTQPLDHARDPVGLLDDASDLFDSPDSSDGLSRLLLPGEGLPAVLRLRLRHGAAPSACLLLEAPKTGPPR